MDSEGTQKEIRLKERFMAMAGMVGTFGAGSFSGVKSQKVVFSLSGPEAMQMDQLIEQGLYSSREDFLQAAARNLIRAHGAPAEPAAQDSGHLIATGIVMHNRKSLEKLRDTGKRLEINIAGIFRLAGDVTPELACTVIKSLKVRGTFQASAEVKDALKERIH